MQDSDYNDDEIDLGDDDIVDESNTSSDIDSLMTWDDFRTYCYDKTGLSVADDETVKIFHSLLLLHIADMQKTNKNNENKLADVFKTGVTNFEHQLRQSLEQLFKKIDDVGLNASIKRAEELSGYEKSITKSLKGFKRFFIIITAINVTAFLGLLAILIMMWS